MIFTAEQVRAIRQGKISAALVKPTEQISAGAVRQLRRRVIRHDEDGQPAGILIETVKDPTPDGDRVPVLLTILDVDDLLLTGLSLTIARACGYRTLTGLRDSWRAQHPRLLVVRLTRFALGDLRDRPRYLSSIPFVQDYTTNIRDAAPGEPEALSAAELAKYAAMNGQKHARTRADHAQQLAMQNATRRLERIESAAAAAGVDVRSEIRIIEQRTSRAEKRLFS